MEIGYSKKFENVLQVAFKSYRIDFAFDSKTKMELWYKALETITSEYVCVHGVWSVCEWMVGITMPFNFNGRPKYETQ